MANPTTAVKNGMSANEVRAAVARGDFTIEDLMSALAGEKMYVRAGDAFVELVPAGAHQIKGTYAKCFRLGDKIKDTGEIVPKRTRKKKA